MVITKDDICDGIGKFGDVGSYRIICSTALSTLGKIAWRLPTEETYSPRTSQWWKLASPKTACSENGYALLSLSALSDLSRPYSLQFSFTSP